MNDKAKTASHLFEAFKLADGELRHSILEDIHELGYHVGAETTFTIEKTHGKTEESLSLDEYEESWE